MPSESFAWEVEDAAVADAPVPAPAPAVVSPPAPAPAPLRPGESFDWEVEDAGASTEAPASAPAPPAPAPPAAEVPAPTPTPTPEGEPATEGEGLGLAIDPDTTDYAALAAQYGLTPERGYKPVTDARSYYEAADHQAFVEDTWQQLPEAQGLMQLQEALSQGDAAFLYAAIDQETPDFLKSNVEEYTRKFFTDETLSELTDAGKAYKAKKEAAMQQAVRRVGQHIARQWQQETEQRRKLTQELEAELSALSFGDGVRGKLSRHEVIAAADYYLTGGLVRDLDPRTLVKRPGAAKALAELLQHAYAPLREKAAPAIAQRLRSEGESAYIARLRENPLAT